MTHETRVFKVSSTQAAELEAALRDGLPPDAEWKSVPHARFWCKGSGVVVTCYNSGKVVVQGTNLDVFQARFFEGAEAAPSKSKSTPNDTDLPFDRPTIGSDETGKGDYFGPLVITACYATPDSTKELEELGVADSKTLDDNRARRLGAGIERLVDFETVVLEPEEYNRRYAEVGNLNILLADLHGTAIGALHERHTDDVEVLVVDRFAKAGHVESALQQRGIGTRLVEVPRAERHLVVAAASIVARVAFLDGLAMCSDACGTDLHKGAGSPVDAAARRVVEIGGRALLQKVAKLHFKNTEKIPNLR